MEHVCTVAGAVTYLGLGTVRALVLSAEVFRAFRGGVPGFSIDDLERRAFTAASVARQVLNGTEHADDAFLAGMLAEVGRLVLADRAPAAYAEVLREHAARRVPLAVVEHGHLGATSAEVGAYLLALWDMPEAIVDAVLFQDAPWLAGPGELGLAAAVYIGRRLALDPSAEVLADSSMGDGLDGSYLSDLGVLDRLPEWRALARRET